MKEMAARVFRLRGGAEYAVFFADSEDELPADGVGRELRAVANRYSGTTRSGGGSLGTDVVIGLLSGSVSAALGAYLPATVKWLRRNSDRPGLQDVTAVLAVVRAAAARMPDLAQVTLTDAAAERTADGMWQVKFAHSGGKISAVVAPNGRVVVWRPETLAGSPMAEPLGDAGQEGFAFVSAAAVDAAAADRLRHDLERAGIRVWRGAVDLRPGDYQPAAIRRAIANGALVFLACFSSASLAMLKSAANLELVQATDEQKKRHLDRPWLIPVRFDECDVPGVDLGGGRALVEFTTADLFGADRDSQLDRLIAVLKQILGLSQEL